MVFISDDFSDDNEDEIVLVIVGKKGKEIAAPKKLLERHSMFFKAALKPYWIEGETLVVELPEHGGEVFQLFADFIMGHEILSAPSLQLESTWDLDEDNQIAYHSYSSFEFASTLEGTPASGSTATYWTSKIPKLERITMQRPDQTIDRLSSALILADRLMSSTFTNALMEALCQRTKVLSDQGRLPLYSIRFCYDNFPSPDHPIRLFLKHLFLNSFNIKGFEEACNRNLIPVELAADLKGICNHRRYGWDDYPWFVKKCTYHEHPDGNRCPDTPTRVLAPIRVTSFSHPDRH